jgi:hypothetical protein
VRGSALKKSRCEKRGKRSASYINVHLLCEGQLRERLLTMADKLGKTLSFRDVMKHDQALHAAIRRRFKTWNKCKRYYQLGKTMMKPALWSKRQIIAAIRKWWIEKGCAPRSNQWRKVSKNFKHPTSATVLNRFGSWQRALAMAGLGRSYA